MTERMFIQGNEAVGWGALYAGCDGFFGYPITPQNEVTQWFAREFPERGRVFLQSQSEVGSINMLYGGAAAGFRVMTSTSSPGWGLMQETISHCVAAELPCVIVLVQRGGPGAGSIRHAQMDYITATRGGGQGGYKNIVLAPGSVQEIHDLVQLAFYLADKYRNPVIILTDGILGQVSESVEAKTIDFGMLPEKDWALKGRDKQKDKKSRLVNSAAGVLPLPPYPNYISWLKHMEQKYQEMEKGELRYETYKTEDAELILVAYGYTSRVSKEAVNMAREEGIKAGLIRPISVWPFPYEVVKEKAMAGCKFLVVEDSLGLLKDDVNIGVEGRVEVHLVGILSRHIPTDGGMIMPGTVFDEIKRLI
ncbi:MAG: 3-methyl-2-oxobutanoate dehydrogenase subunit VorB [Thermodesulfobacteriota bacterium]|nr:3-methyl-2-oxobutanoate dehydrogenase subunit VorB [Thermodesulfobacteriota bacterium]